MEYAKDYMNKSISLILGVAFAITPFYSFAGESRSASNSEVITQEEMNEIVAGSKQPLPEGLSSCFDTYRFGSVSANLTSALTEAAQSSNLAFAGTITNDNPYPVSDITVWAKVFRVRVEGKDINGPDVLAWEPVVTKLTLKAGETRPLSYEWFIPADAEPGTYQIATYVTNLDRFELSGLSFTDDVVGMKTEFRVVGGSQGAVRFDKDAVRVGDRAFYFAAFAPKLPKETGSVPVTANIVNTTATPYMGTVTWKLHYWDRLTSRTLITESTEEVQVNPSETVTLTYTVDDTKHSVYYLVGELETELGSKSIIGVRFVRESVQEPRLNFVTGTPAGENGKGTAVACIHSTNSSFIENGRVELSARRSGFFYDLLALFGLGGLGSTAYEGVIPSDIYAVKMPLTAASAHYVVDAKLYQGGSLVDTVSVTYCESGDCTSMTWVYVCLGLLLAGLLGGIAFAVIKRRRAALSVKTPITPTV